MRSDVQTPVSGQGPVILSRREDPIDCEENCSRQLHPGCDVIGAVERRVVDEAFPLDGGSRLFEVGSHDNEEAVTQGIGDELLRFRPRGPRLDW